MARLAWLAASGIASLLILAPAAGDARSREMQAQRQRGGAMTPQQARVACWREAGFAPNTPRRNYPATLQPQIERCIQQKLGR
ncbi:MAG: hypothetical protein ACRCVA_01360 [Phreatobacter sp.]